MRLPPADAPAWFDGRRVRLGDAGVPWSDPAAHVGLAVFETIALRSGCALELRQHLDRLSESASRMSIALPPRERLEATVAEAAAGEPAPHAWVKVVVTRGGHWLVVAAPADSAEAGRPIAAVVLPWRRSTRDPLAGVKSICYAANELGLEHARRAGADEGLWLNQRGHLAEGCSSNLFVVRRRRVVTPGLGEGVLAGVVRALALEAARDAGLAVHEGRLRLPALFGADEAFVTSSVAGIRPLVRVDRRPIRAGTPGPWTRRIAEAVDRLRSAGGARVASPRGANDARNDSAR